MRKILIILCFLIIFTSFTSCSSKDINTAESIINITEEYGDYTECIHDAVGSYHFIPSSLSEYVGYELSQN